VNGVLKTYTASWNPNRRYRFGTVPTLEQIPSALEATSAHYVLLLAVDATYFDNDRLRRLARILLDKGLARFCVWGPDCSRVHDQFDLERDPNETDGRVVTTTWHDDEPLSEAVWYFAFNAYPSDDFEEDCKDWVAISVGDEAWERELHSGLIQAEADAI
jgi:hypothetical protein